MFENVGGRMSDAGVIGILIAHLGAFGSGELRISKSKSKLYEVNKLVSSPETDACAPAK